MAGEEDWVRVLDEDAFWLSRRGSWTSSVVNVSSPRRVTECTIFSSRTIRFGFTFLACETWDIVGAGKSTSVGPGKMSKVAITRNSQEPDSM